MVLFHSRASLVAGDTQRPVLFAIPGGPGLSSRTLQSLNLDQHFRVSLVDPPGTGGQDQPDFHGLGTVQTYRMVNESIVRAISMSAQPGEPCYLLGHSFGGVHAIDCVFELLERAKVNVQGVILVACAFSPRLAEECLLNQISKYGTSELKHRKEEYFRSPGIESYRLFAASYGELLYGSSHEVGKQIVELLRTDLCCGAATASYTKSFRSDSEFMTRFEKLSIRKLAVLGAIDRLLPAEEAVEEYSRSGCEVAVLGSAGHFPFLDDADGFQQKIGAWLLQK